jgi:hypothetical protein
MKKGSSRNVNFSKTKMQNIESVFLSDFGISYSEIHILFCRLSLSSLIPFLSGFFLSNIALLNGAHHVVARCSHRRHPKSESE